MLVQRHYFGLKHSVTFLVVLKMILYCIFQWVVIFHSEPANLFSYYFFEFSPLLEKKKLVQKESSMTRVNIIWIATS